MNDDRTKLTEVIRSRIQSHLDSSQGVGLGVGVIVAESDGMVFGGKVSTAHAEPPEENTLFEIGSITKVFTTTLLAEMQVAGELNLNDRVNQYLPPEGRLGCRGGDEVTPLRAAIELTHQVQTQFRWSWYRDFGCLGPITFAGLAGLFAWKSFSLPLWSRIAIPIVVPAAMLAFWLTGVIGGLEDMAVGWHFDRLDNDDASAEEWALWHNGATAGFASYLAFSKRHRAGVVLLANSYLTPDAIGRALLVELVQQNDQSSHGAVTPAE